MKILSKNPKKVSSRHFFAFPKSTLKLTLVFSFPFAIIFVSLLAALIFWEKKSHEQDLITELRETARAYFEQILITRLWNSNHGGVYVEVTNKTQPNPYLKDDPERDLVTIDGRKYTKINPAYMTRQISEIAYQKGRYKFHITSLKPVNPTNKADEWEIRQLILFKDGRKEETYEVVSNGKGERFRYMAPLYVEKSCLICHEKYGYKLGDVRGGISIDIPMEVPRSTHMAIAKRIMVAYGIIGITALSFIVAITWLFSKRIVRAVEQEMENERLRASMNLAGAAAHELRQPMTTIIGFAELLSDRVSKGEPAKEEMAIIIQQCDKMNKIIDRMLNITKYKTKTYSDDTEIFDLEIPPDKTDIKNEE